MPDDDVQTLIDQWGEATIEASRLQRQIRSYYDRPLSDEEVQDLTRLNDKCTAATAESVLLRRQIDARIAKPEVEAAGQDFEDAGLAINRALSGLPAS